MDTSRYIPIAMSARLPVEYIPTPQDADLYERVTGASIRLRSQALERKRPIADISPEDYVAEREMLEQEERDLHAAVAKMRERFPVPQIFILSVPTASEREALNARFIQLGLQRPSQELMRATLIEELWQVDHGTGIGTEQNEVEAEQLANFLDSVWMREEVHNEATIEWAQQEKQRILDELAGAPARPAIDNPPRIISVRDNAKQTRILNKMMRESARLRTMAADQADHVRQNALMIARIHIVTVRNIDGITVERDPITRALSIDTVLELREKVDDDSWNDLVAHIDAMYSLNADEVGNSGSPVGKPPTVASSPAPSDGPAISDGTSTGSPTGQAPADAFAETIERSSDFTSGIEPLPVSTEEATASRTDERY